MPPVGIEPTISVGELPQTYALDRAVGRIIAVYCCTQFQVFSFCLLSFCFLVLFRELLLSF